MLLLNNHLDKIKHWGEPTQDDPDSDRISLPIQSQKTTASNNNFSSQQKLAKVGQGKFRTL